MKIATETPTLLVLKQSALVQILFGIVIVIFGIVSIPILLAKGVLLVIISLVIVIVGIITIVISKSITITIDKSANKIILGFKNLLGNKSSDIALDQVAEVGMSESISATSPNTAPGINTMGMAQNTNTQLNFVLIFYLKNGQGVPIPMGTSSNLGFNMGPIPMNMFTGRNKKIELGNKIATFIGVNFRDNRPPTMSDFTSMIGDIANKAEGQTPVQNTQTPIIQS